MLSRLPLACIVVALFGALAPHLRADLTTDWAARADATVAADGSAQYTTVQAAINAAPQTTSADHRWVIYVRAGTYKEKLYIQREKRFISLVGEDAEHTILTYDLNANIKGDDGNPIGTFRTPSTQLDADDFLAENLTFENSAGPVGQALAIRVDGDRDVFRRCRFLGWQDTIFINRGRQYFEDCYIAGHVDFIFGGATAFFERCHIHCLKNGYITAASTPAEAPFGYVFANCRISGEQDVQSYLGRPWRDYAAVYWLNTNMSEVVRPDGWNNWGKVEREKTTRYAEWNSRGKGAEAAARVPWAKPVTAADTLAWNAPNVLAGSDGWNPLLVDVPPARFERDVVYRGVDGQKLTLDIAVPHGEGPFPVALIVHGGGWMGGDKTRDITPLFGPLTSAHFLWISINYRLSPDTRWPGPGEDVQAAIRWVQQHAAEYGGDPHRVAIFGHSAGGHLAFMAAMAAQAAGNGVQAIVGLAPVTDFVADSVHRGGPSKSLQAFLNLDAKMSDDMLPALRDASPVDHVVKGLPPILILQGDADRTVPIEQSQAFHDKAVATGDSCDMQIVHGAPHSVVEWDKHDPKWPQGMIAWLTEKLK